MILLEWLAGLLGGPLGTNEVQMNTVSALTVWRSFYWTYWCPRNSCGQVDLCVLPWEPHESPKLQGQVLPWCPVAAVAFTVCHEVLFAQSVTLLLRCSRGDPSSSSFLWGMWCVTMNTEHEYSKPMSVGVTRIASDAPPWAGDASRIPQALKCTGWGASKGDSTWLDPNFWRGVLMILLYIYNDQ